MESSTIRTIGISTGGGDCPGLNAVIRGVVTCATMRHGWHVIGIPEGFEGLIGPSPSRCRTLSLGDVSGILPRGGTILGTTNRGNPFAYRVQEDGHEVVRDVSDQVIKNARTLGLDALILVGGDGTQRIGLGLAEKGLRIVGVPKTIDNDLSATDSTFGFDSAVHVATEAVDRLHTTAESHRRVMLLEVMGRDAGWIALHAGLAGGAHIILIPEIPFTLNALCERIRHRDSVGDNYTIIVVAEGVKLPKEIAELQPTGASHSIGTVSSRIADALCALTRHEARVTVLGHTQRGGSPSPFDRVLSTRFGVAAVEMLARGESGRMVALRGAEIVSVPLAEACARMKSVAPDGELVRTARSIGVSFGDEAL
jgi:6-phosphofructokinase 1